MAAIQVLQSASATLTPESPAISFTNPVQAGSFLGILIASPQGTWESLSDNQGNSWQDVDLYECQTYVPQPRYVLSANPGATTITIAGLSQPAGVLIFEMTVPALYPTLQPRSWQFYPCVSEYGPCPPDSSFCQYYVGTPATAGSDYTDASVSGSVAGMVLTFGLASAEYPGPYPPAPTAGPDSTLIGSAPTYSNAGSEEYYVNGWVTVEFAVVYSSSLINTTMAGTTNGQIGAFLFGVSEVPTPPGPPPPVPGPCAGIYEESFDDHSILGIPEIDRLDIYNVVIARINTDNTVQTTAARQFDDEEWFENTNSINSFKQQFILQIEATGLRSERGCLARLFLLADRIFRRHAFGTPYYTVIVQLRKLRPELGDFVLLTHRLVPDLVAGTLGISNVPCEVIDREPDYSQGRVTYKLMDTRFISPGAPYLIAPNGTPAWTSASSAQKAADMFISSGSPAKYSDGSNANTIF